MTSRKVLRAARTTARSTTRSAGGRGSRRQDYSSSTRRALQESAASLFTERGYAGTSLDEIVAAARVTKGALYHHFGGKLDLFEHVVEREQRQAAKQIERVLRRGKDPWERAALGLRAFLEVCQEPTYRRLVMQEAPVALGPERWSEIERGSTFGIIEKIVADLLDGVGAPEALTHTFATVFYGAMRAAGELVADAEDAEGASTEVELVIGTILAGLRSSAAELGA